MTMRVDRRMPELDEARGSEAMRAVSDNRTYRIRPDLPHIVEADGFLPPPRIACITYCSPNLALREHLARWWRTIFGKSSKQ